MLDDWRVYHAGEILPELQTFTMVCREHPEAGRCERPLQLLRLWITKAARMMEEPNRDQLLEDLQALEKTARMSFQDFAEQCGDSIRGLQHLSLLPAILDGLHRLAEAFGTCLETGYCPEEYQARLAVDLGFLKGGLLSRTSWRSRQEEDRALALRSQTAQETARKALAKLREMEVKFYLRRASRSNQLAARSFLS